MAPPKIIKAYNESEVICTYDEASNPIVPKKTLKGYAKDVLDVFLPAGYPHTVTPDYTPYQIYDSLQAFSSTIAGLLSSRAVLQGFGVGDSASSATAAVLLTVLQESTGRIATILFAHRHGRAIEPECKYYRFLADIVNDSALFLSILSPVLPPYPKTFALCAAGALRALCGVSGGAAKASLSAHFAKNGNLAELNAKDGSQETVISLLGMLAGSMFVQVVHGKIAVGISMVVLVIVHLWTNYQAVRSVQMRTLNRQRLTIILEEATGPRGAILRPDQVAKKEHILTWISPSVSFGTTFPRLREISHFKNQKYRDCSYVIVQQQDSYKIFLKQGAPTIAALQAWAEAFTGLHWPVDSNFWKALKAAGWDLQTNAMEIGPSVRIVMDDENKLA
ncbi:vitamin B6 photo-protection and homoeostasis-domain-containing protein [Daldinia caldariorum]|uniref:vitamin B6 photo-protection and homoeostasis-domain-containing protein n=1 Tax=Daldinia caldariorum TaxID=326644 RepID=UPI0020085302|nr:vitamin B6 photo-protection and homoeostasis-domain-containing protein [Daldinia caldariorum]KAI1471278.1 vitamin B6 photo-protection and homoeostasis-domain-containing protein [Daldinia caldariorum]